MDFSVITVGCVQNVLSAMQKNLECPICLDVVQEPVSTKCDHIFCRSLKENSRFKQLIEGLLETIRAFELDTGVKFLKSHHFPQTSTEATAAEFLCKESSVIQSKGFRNRKGAKENGQESYTLEATGNTQLTDMRMKKCSLRNKPQKCNSEKGIYMELGSEFEEFFNQVSKTRFEDKAAVQIFSQEKVEELESAEKGNEISSNAQPDKLCAKEMLPNVIGESDFVKEGLSKKNTRSITECAKPEQLDMTECQSSLLNVLTADLLSEKCDRIDNTSPIVDRGVSFEDTEEMDEEQTQYNSENKVFEVKDSSESSLDKSKEMDTDVQSVEAEEVYEPENDSFHDKELPLEKPKTLHSATLNPVPGKRLKQSIQKVNEWFSKSKESLSSSSSVDDSAGATDVSGEDVCSSDKESCISEKTDPVVDSMEIAVIEENKRWSKQTADSIKDKIFGKTYKRERKSNPPSTLRHNLPTTKKEDLAAHKCLDNSSKDRLKRKRRNACVLQPEDFIKKKDTEEADMGPQSVNWCLGDAEKKRCDGSVSVNESHLSQKRMDNTLTELEGGGSTWKKAAEKMTSKHCDGEVEMCNSDQKSTKKTSAAKRCRHSTRTMCALPLVVDRNSVSPAPAEPQIDSYPSSGELRKADSQQNQVRRSRRLQLLSEEMIKETGKGGIVKGARKNDSDHGGSFFEDRRNVATHTAECKDLCEPQGVLSYKAGTNLKEGDVEANEVQVHLKSLSDTAETGKTLFNPASSCHHSNCGFFASHADSQDSEIQGSPILIQPPSVPAVETASQQTEEITESLTAFPQECGHDSQSVPGNFRTENLPLAKNVLELTKEVEDSELDTQYLRNIFRHSKRLSFSLYQTPRQTCAVEDPDSETLNPSCAAQVENKHSKHLQPENLQEEKTTAESLSRVFDKEKLKTCESACRDDVTCFVVSTGEPRHAVPQTAKEGTLTPVTTGAAGAEGKNGSLKGEQGNEKPVSTDIAVESELRENPIKNKRSRSDESNTEEHDSKQTDLNTGHEIEFSSENNLAGKTKGPILRFQSRSMICPATCQQSPAEFSCDGNRIKTSKSKRKRVKGTEEQATQTASTAMPECLVAEALEEPIRGSSDFTGLSESPDGLLCSGADTEEDTNFCETDRREQSAVFVKRSNNASGKELHNRNVGSKPRSQGIQKSRRRAQKLPSSDEESCEDEDLPCFQTLIFGKSVSTPLPMDKQVTSVMESSASSNMLPHSGSNDDNIMQKMPEAALSNVCVSPSQESECSVNLFSSQSMSEESVNGAQELKKPLLQVEASEQVSTVNESEETFQVCNGGLRRTKTSFKDECQEDPNMGTNLGEASGYDSETSIVEDSCGPFSQGEILTTQHLLNPKFADVGTPVSPLQQKNAMQNSLKKLQQEMAVLEAVLKQHGSQDCEILPIRRELLQPSSERTFEMEQMRQEKGSPELLLPSSKSCLLERPDLEKSLECDSVQKYKTSSEKMKPVQEAVQEYRQCQLEAENAEEQKSGTRQSSASVSSNLSENVMKSPSNSSSVKLLNPQTAEAKNGSVVAQNTDESCGLGHGLKRNVCFPIPVLHNAAGKENAASLVVTKRKEMSIVASGLNHSEHLVVQKFARKTQSTLSNHITGGTTHVIMKTDKELVCERTLKYFLGIAGRKWVVSYQWVIQSFKEGRILNEEDFEVRGDVINGRNHQGPKRARQTQTEMIFKDFEICCYGPFTDMTKEHLEWMVELCGASVVKQLHLFPHASNSTAVVVVQPDAWKENTDYRAIQQQNNIAMVTREWVLDSVACYECQKFDAYLVS
ncbi:breast cancer type 1 susceptibility protein isoform X1 [Willisornis vidua]|uniref:Breast cancer type 1 susceptibility protein isoform X1 n=1 Tax=Willisornis vidua TaxID=1566151 RepID=A0ABQ9DFT1_9PASS|nr:breast cancer type 1 susceptibility protein isoform X1 [Willisornis vidua]